MWRFYDQVKEIPGVTLYGDFSREERSLLVTLNIAEMDSAEVAMVLDEEYGISVRAGGHCAPLMHKALGTEKTGTVRFSFSYFNTEEEVDDCCRGGKGACRGINSERRTERTQRMYQTIYDVVEKRGRVKTGILLSGEDAGLKYLLEESSFFLSEESRKKIKKQKNS